MAAKPKSKPADSTANLGFEAKLWLAADKLRNNMDAAEYRHVVLGLIFLNYISDTFEEHHAKLVEGKGDYAGANSEDPDEYKAENVFWVPPAARWSHLQASAKQPTIGKTVDDAMVAIERDKRHARRDLCLPGGHLHKQWEKWRDLRSKDSVKVALGAIAGMGIPTASIAPVAVAASVFLINAVANIGINAMCEGCTEEEAERKKALKEAAKKKTP